MKKFVYVCSAVALFLSVNACQMTKYTVSMGNVVNTEVQLTKANFNVLGSFSGTATEKILKMSIKDKAGLISNAKMALLASAKAAGVELKGARTLTNVTVDLVENQMTVTCTVSAEIIEFTGN